jgi:hypothetical protein
MDPALRWRLFELYSETRAALSVGAGRVARPTSPRLTSALATLDKALHSSEDAVAQRAIRETVALTGAWLRAPNPAPRRRVRHRGECRPRP